MWNAIKTHNLGADRVKEERLQNLITYFENLKISDTRTIDDFCNKIIHNFFEIRFIGRGHDITEACEDFSYESP